MQRDSRISVVVITRDRVNELLDCIARLRGTEASRVLVVDNGSSDGSPYRVRAQFPDVDVVALPHNAAAAARNIGVARCETPYVAFADDDSGWHLGSLSAAADILDAYPSVAVVAAEIRLDDGRIDPLSTEMSMSSLGAHAAGRRILGFAACGAVVRRTTYLEAGGFHPTQAVGGEEVLLAWDIAALGSELVYSPRVVASHRPSVQRDVGKRHRQQLANGLITTWLRRPFVPALQDSVRQIRHAWHGEPSSICGSIDAATHLREIRRGRSVNPAEVEEALRSLESVRAGARDRAGRRDERMRYVTSRLTRSASGRVFGRTAADD
jgi:hypothetical protein